MSDNSDNTDMKVPDIDKKFMRMAIKLARKGEGRVNPNPLVGAVIVKDGRVIGHGYHECYGGLHAERNAFLSLSEDACGSDLYVTLEPCNHYGKTPPCTDIIIENKVKRVIIGSDDPNPLVNGKGIKRLRDAGIEVVSGFMKEECNSLNSVFFHYISTGLPYVMLKYAMTLDGKICTSSGQSKWISCEESRNYAHVLRNKYSAIMVGINTVCADDPLLNCRIEGKRSPVRVICDSNLKISTESKIVKTAQLYRTIIACAVTEADHNLRDKVKVLTESGAQVVCFNRNGKVDLNKLFQYLGSQNIDSVMVEGGGTLNEAVLRECYVNEADVFISPKIFGGTGKNPVMGRGVENIVDAYGFLITDVKRFGTDVMLVCKKK